MAIQTVNLGTAPTGAGGDTFRSTGAKINENFGEIYSKLGDGANLFTPIQQGGGQNQLPNKIYIGWSGSTLKAQVDNSDLGDVQTSLNNSVLFGVGQSWIDVKGSRNIGTTYTNSSTRPIAVFCQFQTLGIKYSAYVNGIVCATTRGVANYEGIFFIVPPEASYSVRYEGDLSTTAPWAWSELK